MPRRWTTCCAPSTTASAPTTLAKISTEGTRVIDVFYVSEGDGSKVEPGARTEQVRQVRSATLCVHAVDA